MDIFDLSASLHLNSDVEEGLNQAEGSMNGFASKLGNTLGTAAKVGGVAFTAVTGAAVGMAGAFASSAGSVAEYGDNIDKASQKMGISAQAYQEWDAILQHSGTSIDGMQRGMVTLSKAAESNAEEFQKLGLSQEQIASMNQEELFAATIKGLQNMESGTERTVIAQKLLGGASKELGALLNTSAEDTEAMRQKVHELGGVMSDEAVKSAAAYQDSLQDMQTSFSGLRNNLMAEFLPSITTVMDGLSAIFSGNDGGIDMITSGLDNLFSGIGEALPKIAEIATQIITALSATFVSSLPKIVEAGISIVGTLAQALFENLPLIGEAAIGVGEVIVNTLTEYAPTLLEQGFNMLTNLAMGIINNAPMAVDSLGQVIDQILAYIEENLPGFLDKGISAIEQMASGILQNLPAVISSMGEIVTNTISFLMEHLPEYLQKGVEMLQHIGQGIMDNLPEILTTMGKVLVDILGTIAEHLPEYLQKGVEMLVEVGKGLIQAIPQVLAMLPEIFSSILDEFGKFDWASIGSNIINGIINGVKAIAGNLGGAVIGAVSDAWDGLVGWLDIRSPSHKAEKVIGKNWALGIGTGFEKNMPEDEMLDAQKSVFDKLREGQDDFDFPDIEGGGMFAGGGMNNNENGLLGRTYALLVRYLPALANMKVTLNGDTVIGELIEGINEELGAIADLEAAQ